MNPVLSFIVLVASVTASAEEVNETSSIGCRSWFARSQFDGPKSDAYIAATSSMHGCNAENRSYHGNSIDFVVGGERIVLNLRSVDYPEVAKPLDDALRIRAQEGITKEDASFALQRLLPVVKAAAVVSDEDDRREALTQAKSLWKDYLLTTGAEKVAPKPKPPTAL